MPGHVAKEKAKLLNRLRRLRGQIEALERAVDADEECTNVLQQATSCRGALDGFIAEVIEDHVREHMVGDGVAASDPRARAAARTSAGGGALRPRGHRCPQPCASMPWLRRRSRRHRQSSRQPSRPGGAAGFSAFKTVSTETSVLDATPPRIRRRGRPELFWVKPSKAVPMGASSSGPLPDTRPSPRPPPARARAVSAVSRHHQPRI